MRPMFEDAIEEGFFEIQLITREKREVMENAGKYPDDRTPRKKCTKSWGTGLKSKNYGDIVEKLLDWKFRSKNTAAFARL